MDLIIDFVKAIKTMNLLALILYKKSHCLLSESVNNINIRPFLIIILTPIFLISCQKNIDTPVTSSEAFHINERLASQTKPYQFYLCGNNSYPCHRISNRWSSNRAIKPDLYLKSKKLIKEKSKCQKYCEK